MLFTPKKYGKDWTRFLGHLFCAASIGFAFFSMFMPWAEGDLSDRIFGTLAFIAAAIVCGALGRDHLKRASKMPR